MTRRIVWIYNLPGGKKKRKHGEYYCKIKHQARYKGPQLAMVRLDGNSRTTNIPFYQMTEEENGN